MAVNRVGRIAEIITGAESGLPMEKEYAGALASAIGQLLESSSSAERMGQQA